MLASDKSAYATTSPPLHIPSSTSSIAGTESSPPVTSNIDLREWGRYLGDATVAAAILDRLAMHAIRIDIDGPSYRQHVAAERSGHRPATAPPPS
jgi:hypothetical protein